MLMCCLSEGTKDFYYLFLIIILNHANIRKDPDGQDHHFGCRALRLY